MKSDVGNRVLGTEERFSGVRVQGLGGFELNDEKRKILKINLAHDLILWIFGMLHRAPPWTGAPRERMAEEEMVSDMWTSHVRSMSTSNQLDTPAI